MGGQRRPRYADDVLGGPDEAERLRLAAMAEVCDPTTTRVLDELGVAAGWRCLEVGAGAGSIAAWLADRVAAAGHVVATDIDTSHLADLAASRANLTVLRHDVTRDPAPDGGPFDLVHARFVLEHLPEREEVLDRLVAWLKPGGVLVLESIAEFPVDSSPHPPFRAAMRGIGEALARTIGTDSGWARGFPGPLRDRRLVDVGTAVHLPATGGANASARCWTLTLTRLRPRIRELDLASEDTLDEALAQLADPAFFDLAFATVIAWGRGPAGPR
ncbi:methyltransferase domain-containing protein [Frankia sp. CNm7]|uniref:Methyltransferase domain-containing protein n=1 Tax=Frankia nepalensis TaxID=1836974 RepID=A0A937ULL2_9ACTN|nr:class I SAM-dependent methyltransferase [Frankia nepalensis]MBL7496924.1 methyltransferase domain-containing protein [Frankia nepalensis]MBL7508315.1 methyltransferase domain-containing protein [Frankia nepalensis]MBL7520993.1 methyltransferase domain-containing protein [Frankia nepalensis]MBL7626143.1 methyltransferase domain-containing protein [Frankia nepalensis]